MIFLCKIFFLYWLFLGTDFFTVAVHELGHSLGLAHSSNPSSVMFPYYSGYDVEQQFSLDYDDILGIYELYSKSMFKKVYFSLIIFFYKVRRYIKGDEELPDEFDTTTRKTTTTTTTTTTTPIPITTTRTTTPVANTTFTYEGDYESVETHKTHETTFQPKATMKTPLMPNICDGHFDAVATLRNELFIFKEAVRTVTLLRPIIKNELRLIQSKQAV